MSNQKHTVSTDALDTLGTHPIPDNSGRDAIHLAVEPAVAGHMLSAGQRVKIDGGFAVAASHDATGIVDPFLIGFVTSGQRFWFVVLPRTITSLRHVWSHPAFPEEATFRADADEHYVTDKAASEAWMRKWAMEHVSYDYYGDEGGRRREDDAYNFAIEATCDQETAYADAAAYLADLPGEFAKSGCKQFENNWCSCSHDCAQVQS